MTKKYGWCLTGHCYPNGCPGFRPEKATERPMEPCSCKCHKDQGWELI